ncbi:PREDICTED: apoptosis facilitator Bcl-2-like protein 14 [Ceratotherium simum simum]|uniref:Apoptosis facilitator Bcl-2-like protein 14 n=1 Tax=Ceratotherium simum simum TaxID=73337 RepID=A0ABM0HWH0_CERSS|nr:PREDICTED: apoptosis facilitator Bcl-2-like protein 14 [Ceratotherium simum simum]
MDSNTKKTDKPTMCTTSACDLEEVPLDDDDPNSLEFKILEFYVKHHVFKNTSAVFSPKLLRTRSLSQKGVVACSANESWTQVSWPCRNSQSSEKTINLAKKKSSWRTLFGVVEKEEDAQSLPTVYRAQDLRLLKPQGSRSHQSSRDLSNVEQHSEDEAVDPKVVSIANRVAEIVYSWPPPEEPQNLGGRYRFEGLVEQRVLHPQPQSSQSRPASAKKDEEDQIIAKIVELLKYSGDQMERELKRDKALKSFQNRLSYSVIETITDQFLMGVDTRGESEVKAQGFKAALAIDVMAKLTAVYNHPMNRMLGFGTRYLKERFSPWVQQHGGWAKVLGISHEEVD